MVKVVWNAGHLNTAHAWIEQTRKGIGAKGKFAYYGSGTVTNAISAEVTFNDGSIKNVPLSPDFQSPVDDGIHLRSTYRPIETGGGAVWFDVDLDLYASRNELFHKIDHVEWLFGPPFENQRRVAIGSTTNFNVSVSTLKEFRVRAKVIYRDGSVKELSHWVELGPSGKYADVRRIEMQATNSYLGVLAGKPNWRVRIRPMGDWDTLDTLQSVKYKVPAAVWPGGIQEVPAEKTPRWSIRVQRIGTLRRDGGYRLQKRDVDAPAILGEQARRSAGSDRPRGGGGQGEAAQLR